MLDLPLIEDSEIDLPFTYHTKVRVVQEGSPGYPGEIEKAREAFGYDDIFTTHVKMGQWYSYVKIEGSDLWWNTALFEDVD